MIDMNDIIPMIFSDSELKTERVANKIDKLCEEDLIYCYECPYLKEDKCTIHKYVAK